MKKTTWRRERSLWYMEACRSLLTSSARRPLQGLPCPKGMWEVACGWGGCIQDRLASDLLASVPPNLHTCRNRYSCPAHARHAKLAGPAAERIIECTQVLGSTTLYTLREASNQLKPISYPRCALLKPGGAGCTPKQGPYTVCVRIKC